MKNYKTILIPVKCSKEELHILFQYNRLSAQVWNLCLELDKKYKEENKKHISNNDLQKQTKKCIELPAKCIHHVVHKYLFARDSMFKSIKAKHKNSNKVKLPYRTKKYFTTGWDYQSIKTDYNKGLIQLVRPKIKTENGIKRQESIKCYSKNLPQNIKEVELIWRNKLYLAIKYLDNTEYQQIQSNNTSAIDLGEIHAITSIDNNGNAIIITGRKLRSIKYLRNKNQARIYEKMSKCTKGSKQYKKYIRSLEKLRIKTENHIKDGVHKVSKHYLDYCLNNNINTVYYGDLDSCTRNTRKKHVTNTNVRQKLSQWNYGLLMQILENKLKQYGIKLIKVKEYYTSKTCPECGCLNKPKKRNYKCDCGYTQHRDIVGSINILNTNSSYRIKKYNNKKYLQIA